MMRRSPGSIAAVVALVAFFVSVPSADAAQFTVTSVLDSAPDGCDVGTCTLREAVETATASAGPDDISVPAGRYVLTGGALTIDSDTVSIDGAGSRSTIVDADGGSRAFEVENAGLELSDLTVVGGSTAQCGGEGGGGVLVGGADAFLDTTDVRITQSQALGIGGGIANFEGTVTLTRTEVDHNSSCGEGGGIVNGFGSLELVDSYVHDNRADGAGGGIFNIGEPEGNPCEFDGECQGADAVASLHGVAPSEVGGELLITDSTISDNTSDRFGAFQGGGGIASYVYPDWGSETTLGEVGTRGPVAKVVNSTVSGNSSTYWPGGGIYVGAGGLELTNDTITENRVGPTDDSDVGAGLGVSGDSDSTASVKNTIIAENRTNAARDDCGSVPGAIVDAGNNLSSDASCGFPAASSNKDPLLGPLADNGGPTPTHALRDGSPAIDTADNGAGPEFDQRGGDRPPDSGSAGATRDIGAYEAYSLADLTVEGKGAGSNPVVVGSPLTYTVIARNNGPDRVNGVTLVDALPADVTGGSFETSAGTCSGTYTCALGNIEPGQTVKLTFNTVPHATGVFTNVATVGALGITDPNQANNSGSAATLVNPAPVAGQGAQQQLPPRQTPQQQTPADKKIVLNVKVPKTIDVDTFMKGFDVEADCGDEACLRKFREHAAINTGATQIAGFNLTISRTSLGFTKTKTKVKMRPCLSGSTNGQRHKRCLRNLRAAAEKAAPFRVKVVVAAVDKAGNRKATKRYIKVTP